MEFKLFGFTIKKTEKQIAREEAKSFVAPTNEDGAVSVEGVGAYGAFLDLEGTSKNEFELVTRYREMSLFPEVDGAIDDIVNEAIVLDGEEPAVKINLSDLKINESVKQKISDEFETVLSLMNWNNNAYDIFKKWYIDGRLFYHVIINQQTKDGILELRYIDPRQIRKVRELERTIDSETGIETIKLSDEYYVFNSRGLLRGGAGNIIHSGVSSAIEGLKINVDSILYVHSGIADKFSSTILSHLHKAIKPINQLKMMEDAVVIYRIARAPERRIFYVDVGNLPKTKADSYLRDIMQRYRNKLVYNIETGEMKDDRRFLSMLEDFWLPRREGSTGTSIETLPGGENLGEMTDVEYFQKKVYKALNVPITRLDANNGFQLGRAAEITRDELKFSKFIHRLRLRFTHLFDELLKKQLILKGIVNADEWEVFKEKIRYDFNNDNYFAELKQSEILKNRLELIERVDPYTQKYFSTKWIREKVLKQSEDEQIEVDKEIQKEKQSGVPQIPVQTGVAPIMAPMEQIIKPQPTLDIVHPINPNVMSTLSAGDDLDLLDLEKMDDV